MVCSIISSIQAAEMRVMYWRIHDALFTLDAEYELVFLWLFFCFFGCIQCVCVFKIFVYLFKLILSDAGAGNISFDGLHTAIVASRLYSRPRNLRASCHQNKTQTEKNLCSSAAKTNVCRLCAGAFCWRFWLSPGIMWLLPSTVVHQCDRFSACKPVVWATKTGEREKVNNMRNEFNLCALTGVDH